MIQLVADALIRMTLAKFLLNDVPHAAGILPGNDAERQEKISRYYKETHTDYERFWKAGETLSLHYGYHRRPDTPFLVAARAIIAKLAISVPIKSTDTVLDAGCGVGGSANWLAENIGCKVIGINISEDQLATARQHAYSGVEFINMDYLNTSFPSNTFDVVWALESACYAPDKAVFLREVYRILKVGGKIAVADGFGSEPDMHILQGWAIPNLAGVDQFTGQMVDTGFKNIEFENITKNVMPSSRRMYMAAMSVYPIHKASKYLHLRTQAQQGNVEAAIEQYGLLSRGKFKYCIFVGEK